MNVNQAGSLMLDLNSFFLCREIAGVTNMAKGKSGRTSLNKIGGSQHGIAAKPIVVIGIPAFNVESTIGRVVLQSQKYADKVVVCDDGCSDLTVEIARRLGADVVRHATNLGYGAAIQTLFKRARELGATVLVTLDGDGQHDPSEAPNVIQPVINGVADIAVGSRLIDKSSANDMPWYRKVGIKLISKVVNNETNQGIADTQSGFRAYNGKCLEKLAVTENGMGASVEVLINARKQGLRIQEVPIKCSYGKDVKKHVHNPMRHGAGILMSIVKLVIEDRPLLFLGVPGILCLAIGAFFGVWMLQLYSIEHRIVTNIALASLGFVLVGFFALSTAITLYAISRLEQKRNRKR